MFHVFEDPDRERPRGPKMKLARSRRTRRGGDEESHTPLLGLLVVNGKRGHVPGGAKAKDTGVEVELAVEGVLDVLCLAEAVLLALVNSRARSATRAVRFLGDMESPVHSTTKVSPLVFSLLMVIWTTSGGLSTNIRVPAII